MQIIAKGAEAELFEATVFGRKALCKRRVRKRYRIHELDVKLRESRTRQEAKLLHAAKLAGVRCPLVLHADLLKKELFLENVEGTGLREYLRNHPLPKALLQEVGKRLASLHLAGIIHGDFTPSNILVTPAKKVVFIDFGLGSFSSSLEEQATDVLLFKKSVSEKQFNAFWKGYAEKNRKAKKVLVRLKEIEKRGRYVVRAQAG